MILIILLYALVAAAAVAQISIGTPPSLAQCQDTSITWTGGTAPYYVYIYPESYLDESSFLERLGPTNEDSIEYSVKVTAGKKIRINVRDSVNPGYEGTAFTDVIAITSGGDNWYFQGGVVGTSAIPLNVSWVTVAYCSSGDPTISAPFADTAVPPPFFGTGAPTLSGIGAASSALASQLSVASSIASAAPTEPRNGDKPVNGDAPNAGVVVGGSSLFVGSVFGLVVVPILMMW